VKILLITFPDGISHLTSSLYNSMKVLGNDVVRYVYTNLNRDFLVYSNKIPIVKQLYDKYIKLIQNNENKILLKLAKKFKPDILFSIKGEAILPKTIEEIKKNTGAFTILWAIDDPYKFESESKYISQSYDFVFTSGVNSVKDYKRIGVKAKYIPFAADHRIFRKVEVNNKEYSEYGSSISFVGRRRFQRIELLNAISDMDLKIWGPNWKNWFRFIGLDHNYNKFYNKNLIKKCTGITVNTDQYVKIINSTKINLNIHPKLWKMKSNLRTFEVTMAGGFLLTDKPDGFSDLFKPGRDVICFNSKKELRELCEYYLDNEDERIKIAERGQKKALKYYTLDNRVQQILKFIKIHS